MRGEIIDNFQAPAVDIFIGGAGRGVDGKFDNGVAIVAVCGKAAGIEPGPGRPFSECVVEKSPLPVVK